MKKPRIRMMKKGLHVYEDFEAKSIHSVPKEEHSLYEAIREFVDCIKQIYDATPAPAKDFVKNWAEWRRNQAGSARSFFDEYGRAEIEELMADNPATFDALVRNRASDRLSDSVLKRRVWGMIEAAAEREEELEDDDEWDEEEDEEGEEISVNYLYDELNKFREEEQVKGLHRLSYIQELMKKAERMVYTYARKQTSENDDNPMEVLLEGACLEIVRQGGTMTPELYEWWEERRNIVYYRNSKQINELESIVEKGETARKELEIIRNRIDPPTTRQVIRRIRLRRK